MLVKLRSGTFEGDGTSADNGATLDKRALLCYAGDFLSINGPVSVTGDQLRLLADRHNSVLGKIKRLAKGDVRLSACPPVQVDHSMSAHDTVGRLVGDLDMDTVEIEDGVLVPALYGNLRILGRENVERVQDGRWTHLSIGCDFELGVLSEMTITPFPAAANAQMLRAQDGYTEPPPVADPVKPDPVQLVRLQEQTVSIKQYLMKCEGLSADEADAKIAAMTDEEKAALEEKAKAYADKQETEMAAAQAARVTKLTAAKDQLTQLSTDFRKATDLAKLAARRTSILSTFSKLRAQAKITPAEIKKLSIDDLAKAEPDALKLALATYENRQPVILTGQFGSTKGTTAGAVEAAKKVQLSQLEAEMRANMSTLRSTAPKGLKLSSDAEMPGGAPPGTKDVTNEGQDDDAFFEREYQTVCQLLDEGKSEELKVRLKGWMQKLAALNSLVDEKEELAGEEDKDGEDKKGYTDVNAEETEKELSAVNAQITALEAKFNEVTQVALSIADA